MTLIDYRTLLIYLDLLVYYTRKLERELSTPDTELFDELE
jgi:hypothetical protein